MGKLHEAEGILGHLPLAVAEARRGSGASPRASYLKSCWWYQRRNGTISTLLEPEVALGLALFQQQADVRLLKRPQRDSIEHSRARARGTSHLSSRALTLPQGEGSILA